MYRCKFRSLISPEWTLSNVRTGGTSAHAFELLRPRFKFNCISPSRQLRAFIFEPRLGVVVPPLYVVLWKNFLLDFSQNVTTYFYFLSGFTTLMYHPPSLPRHPGFLLHNLHPSTRSSYFQFKTLKFAGAKEHMEATMQRKRTYWSKVL